MQDAAQDLGKFVNMRKSFSAEGIELSRRQHLRVWSRSTAVWAPEASPSDYSHDPLQKQNLKKDTEISRNIQSTVNSEMSPVE